MTIDSGDVLLFQTVDDGEIAVTDGIVSMTNGFETAVYLSLFGGNDDDSGRADDDLTWWGNIGARDPDERMVSQTQNMMRGLPVTSGSLPSIRNAIKNDLSWMSKYVENMEITLAIPGPKRIDIRIRFDFNGAPVTLNYTQNWEPIS